MNFWRNVIGLTLAGGLLGVSGAVTGCVGGAEAKMAAASGPSQVSTTSENAPAPVQAHWRFTTMVEHGPAGRIGQNAVWDLSVFEIEGRRVARLRKLALDGETLEPGHALEATFAFEPRPLASHEQQVQQGQPVQSRWANAEVVEANVELRGAFAAEPIELRLWVTEHEIVGAWSAGGENERGGPLLGSSRTATPPQLRDVDALPLALRCEALGKSEADCLPTS